METPVWVGKYEIEQFLGGGMSHVFRARDSVLGRRVALKMLTGAAMADPEAKARFLEEARTASNLRHENIINVFDFGEDNGRPFMVMEFLEGESLRAAIENNSLGNMERRLRVALQVGRAIDYIHARKIVHRDIKPENVNVDLTGRAKLMDFGIAKSDGGKADGPGRAPSETAAGALPGLTLGTPFYMAPEQVLGRPLTPHADIYSYGVMLYEILTGTKAVTADTVDKIFQQVVYEPVRLEPLAAAGVPAPVIEAIGRCTAKQMVQRPSNLGVVCDQIERVLEQGREGVPVAAQDRVPVLAPTGPVAGPPSIRQLSTSTPAKAAGIRTASGSLGSPLATADQTMPWVFQKLPKDLQSSSSIMILTCGGVALFAMLLYAFLLRLHVM